MHVCVPFLQMLQNNMGAVNFEIYYILSVLVYINFAVLEINHLG